MDSILRVLQKKREDDDVYAASVNKDKKLVHPTPRKVTERLYALQIITFAGCKRCNDLMTMQQPTSQMCIACGILKTGFHKTRMLVRQAREYLRAAGEDIGADASIEEGDDEEEDNPQLYGIDDRNNAAGAAEEQPAVGEQDGAEDDRVNPGADDATLQREALRELAKTKIKSPGFSEKLAFKELLRRSVERARLYFPNFTLQELYTLFHAYAYVLAANLTTERVERDIHAHDKFRIDGLQKIYTSFFFYVVNTVRFPEMFMQLPFEIWHVSFFEARTLNMCVSFRASVFQNERFVPEYTRKIMLDWDMMEQDLMKKTRIGLLRMMISPRTERVDIPRFSSDQVQLWRWRLPSIWQIAWIAMGNHATEKRVSRANAMLPEHRRYFPTPSYTRFVYDNLFTVTELNIDRWVEEFGRRMMYRRLLSTAQFSLDTVLLDYIQKTLVLVKPEGSESQMISVRKRNYVKFMTEMFIEMNEKSRMEYVDAGDYHILQLVDLEGSADPLKRLRKDYRNEANRYLLFAVGPQSDHELDDSEGPLGMQQVVDGMAALAVDVENFGLERGYNAEVEAVRSAEAERVLRQEHTAAQRVIAEDLKRTEKRRSARIAAQPYKNVFQRLERNSRFAF